MIYLLLSFLTLGTALATVGEVVSISSEGKGSLERKKNRLPLAQKTPLKVRDTISSQDAELELWLYPGTQVNLGKDSKLSIISGQPGKKAAAPEVNLTGAGTTFEVLTGKTDVEVRVLRGEVVISSPHIQTFVPEIIKKGERLRYDGREKAYVRLK